MSGVKDRLILQETQKARAAGGLLGHAETLATLIDIEFAHLKPSPEIKYADYVVSGTIDDGLEDVGTT